MQAAADPLANLRDIHLPDPVSWWPLAVGWWLLLFSFALLVWVVWRSLRARRRGLLRFARLDLHRMEADYTHDQDPVRLAIRLAELLRRVALVRFPRQDVASLTGPDWSKFLSEQVGQQYQTEFDLLEKAPYVPLADLQKEIDAQRVLAATRHWIRRNAS